MAIRKKHKPLIKIIQQGSSIFQGYGHREHRANKKPLTQAGNKKQILQEIKNKEQEDEINKLKK